MIVQRVVELLKETAAVSTRTGDRVYPVEWPDAPEFPLVIVQRVGGRGETTNQGEAGIEQARVQIDVYSNRGYADMAAIVLEVRRLLHGFKGGPKSAPCVIDRSECINAMDQPVPRSERAGPRLRRRTLEFIIWNREV